MNIDCGSFVPELLSRKSVDIKGKAAVSPPRPFGGAFGFLSPLSSCPIHLPSHQNLIQTTPSQVSGDNVGGGVLGSVVTLGNYTLMSSRDSPVLGTESGNVVESTLPRET